MHLSTGDSSSLHQRLHLRHLLTTSVGSGLALRPYVDFVWVREESILQPSWRPAASSGPCYCARLNWFMMPLQNLTVSVAKPLLSETSAAKVLPDEQNCPLRLYSCCTCSRLTSQGSIGENSTWKIQLFRCNLPRHGPTTTGSQTRNSS